MKYNCIIFDCDGVLVDSEGISTAVLIEMANELGGAIELEEARTNFTGKSLKSIFADLETVLQKQLPDNFEQAYRARSFEAFATKLQPIKGIQRLLDQITVPYCVASNGPLEKIRLNLTKTGLLKKFKNRIFSAYEIGKWKPDPALFLYAAAQMGFEPQECVVIEDSSAGVIAARKAGFEVFGFANQHNQQELEKEGAKVFFEMEALHGLLQ